MLYVPHCSKSERRRKCKRASCSIHTRWIRVLCGCQMRVVGTFAVVTKCCSVSIADFSFRDYFIFFE